MSLYPCYPLKQKIIFPASLACRYVCMLFCLVCASLFSQTEDTGFPKKYVNYPDTVSCVREDTLGNIAYITTINKTAGHNEWRLTAVNLSNYQYGETGNSDNDILACPSEKLIFSQNILYAFTREGKVMAYSPAKKKPLWTYTIPDPSISYLKDILLYGDTLLFCGSIFENFSTGFAALDAKTGKLINWPQISDSAGGIHYDWSGINKMLIYQDILYIGGSFTMSAGSSRSYLAAINLRTLQLTGWNPSPDGEIDDFHLVNDKLYVCGNFTRIAGAQRKYLACFDLSSGNPALTPFSIDVNGRIREMEHYLNELFISGDFTIINEAPRNYVAAIDPGNLMLSSWQPVFASWVKLNRERNRLYTFRYEKDIFRVFCLKPGKPFAFSQSKLKACHGDMGIIFSIPPLPYAVNYEWGYSGSGVIVRNNGPSVRLDFSNKASSGKLSVRALSYCGEKSDSLSVYIKVNPLPLISSGADDTVTCDKTEIILRGLSNSQHASYTWSGSGQCKNCPVFPVTRSGIYILTVTDTATGCIQRDTTIIRTDTIKPSFSLPQGPFVLTCKKDTVVLKGNSPFSNTSIWWHRAGSVQNYANPCKVSSIGQYYMVVKNTKNGCRDSSSLIVSQQITPPDVRILSHVQQAGKPLDTLNCKKTMVSVLGGSVTANTSVSWHDTSFTSLGNPAIVRRPGKYTLQATDTVNGCSSRNDVFILKDITPPHLFLSQSSYSLTCTDTSADLMAVSHTPLTTLHWNGPGNFYYANPARVSDTGKYYITAKREDNGCRKTDSIQVIFIPKLRLITSNDTVVCRNSTITLKASVDGNFPASYQWSDGSSGQVISISPSASALYVVTANGIKGCSGTESIYVSVPPLITDSVSSHQNCDGSYTGTVQVHARGGIPPYFYSLDKGKTFQPSPVFSKLSFGSYEILIKDSLGCLKTTYAVLSGNSNLPQPRFIVSSFNNSGDTLVFVDISNPRPDSVEWIFPAGFTLINKNSFHPELVVSDTGSFSVMMFAWFGKCRIPVTGSVHISKNDSSLAGRYNNNGIKNISLYPNPSSGIFTVELGFYKKQNFVVQVADAASYIYFSETIYTGAAWNKKFNFSNLQNGTYILRIIAEFDTGYKTFIINK